MGCGGGNAIGQGIRDITLTNGPANSSCYTNGGCGYSTYGVTLGGTNGGCEACVFENVKVSGFGHGFYLNHAASSNGWGNMWLNSSIVWNTTGLSYGGSQGGNELDKFIGGIINTNGTGVNLGVYADETYDYWCFD